MRVWTIAFSTTELACQVQNSYPRMSADMITGVHAVILTTDAERDRAFFRDVLKFPLVDAGDGWLIFALPPAELAAHPAAEGGQHELYLMCDDVHASVAELKAKGVDVARPISDEGFGLVTAIRLPSGGELGLYQPRHFSPLYPDPSTS
jgi:predicted enzyme related to lactoylglutathione lyase